jgi:pimeloyl-ACP methyl ester carboxylesterase
MGAHTAARLATRHPERVAGLVLITPAYDERSFGMVAELEHWDVLASGLREGGVEGFVAAYPLAELPAELRGTIETVLRQRLGAHAHPEAIADALEAVPRSRPIEALEDLAQIAVPSTVVASRDEADPSHPLAVGEAWARWIPGASLLVEDAPPPLHSPLAWQGGRLSKVIADVAARASQ